MRSYQRKTLVKREGWPLVDGWYWCPESVVEKRIKMEEERLKRRWQHSGVGSMSWDFETWKDDQWNLEARLAHACQDGRIRAASGWGVETFRNVGGIVKIYGKCRFCDEALSDGIKTIIVMETEL